MAESAALWRVLDDLPVAAALVDLDGTIRQVNTAAVRRYGWRSAEAAVGLSAAVLGQGLPERLGSGSWRGELTATGGDGGTFLAAFEVGPFHDEDGTVVGSIVMCLDATRRADAERAAERLARLQAVTARLVGARSADEVAAVVCDHAAAGLGAESAVFLRLVDDGATFQLVRQIGFSAEVEEAFRRFPSDASLPATDAIRTRSIVVLPDEVELDARYPQPEPHPMRKQAHAVVPMFYGERAEGAIGLGFRRPADLDDDDRRFLLAVAAQAAQALDRVRRDDLERIARRRQELLARATGVLAGSIDPEGMATTIGRLGVQELADSWSVHLHDGTALRPAAVVHRDPLLEQEMVELAADRRGEALTRHLAGLVAPGRSLLLPVIEPDDWRRWLGDESLVDVVTRFDPRSAIVVGLHSGGKRLGVLSVTRGRGRSPFDQDDFVLVAELAGRLAAAVDGAMAHRARAEVARTLQASLLPPHLPEIAGVALAARYDPVGDGSLVGGDFYDAFPIGSDRWGLVLGDVCGQGVPAAALTSLVRYTVRAAARVWQSPADILRFTNDAILDDDTGERFCTLLVCVLRPRTDGATLTLAAAGHHLPLLHSKGGEPEPVGTPGTALGLVRNLDVADATVELGLGDVLVLSTDGVIEARDASGAMVDERFLEDLLVEHAGEGADALAGVVERTVLAVSGGRARDDVAIVVAEITGIDIDRPADLRLLGAGPFSQRYRAELVEVPSARRSVAAWLAGQDVRPAMVPDLLLVVTELVTNAIRAARSMVEVRCWLTGGAVMVEVTDDGPGFDAGTQRTPREPDPLAERGRGLFLVAALVDECTIESGPNGTIVRCFASN